MNQSSTTVQLPTIQPVSLSEAKNHLSVAEDDDSLEPEIRRTIVAAREQWELDTASVTTVRTITEDMATWPVPGTWRFRYRPIVSIDSITYIDANGDQQTLDAAKYQLDAPRFTVHPVDPWPAVSNVWNAITIKYEAGMLEPSEISKQAILLQLDVMFELRGKTNDKTGAINAYEALVDRYMRGSYP